MRDWVEISEPTVRECLQTLEEEGLITVSEVSQTGFYIPDESMLPQPDESMLPQPDESEMYENSDDFFPV
ncbi:hypothetical protein GCM10009000_104430 [Halobacterium noricense]